MVRLALLVVLETAGLWSGAVTAAPAQVLPIPAVAMTGMTLADASPSAARLLLSFTPAAPSFTIVENDAATVVIAFNDTRLAPGIPPIVNQSGIVRSIGVAQSYGALTLTIVGSRPIHAIAQPGAGGAMALTLAVPAQAPAAADVVAAPAGAPAVTGMPAYGVEEAFEVVPLKYADVSEIVGLLTGNQNTKPNDNFIPQEPAFGSASLQGGYYGSGIIPTASAGAGLGSGALSTEPLGSSVDDSIGVDRRLNAIVLKGPAARVARLKEEIAKLDVPVTSVMLETVFVELTETGAKDAGIDFTNGSGQIATVSYAYSSGNYPGVSGTSRTGGVAANLQAAIYAQISKGEGRIISKPKIAAQSGQSAKIVTGDALPILTAIALSGVNAVQQQVQYVNVGVTLQIAPRVSDDGYVSSHIFAVVSSVTGYSQGYPTISQREATTSATVKDGEAFIIGGLTQETSLAVHNKTPILGDVPVLGTLFQNVHARKTKTDLYVIVTPHVVRGTHPDAPAAGPPSPKQPASG